MQGAILVLGFTFTLLVRTPRLWHFTEDTDEPATPVW